MEFTFTAASGCKKRWVILGFINLEYIYFLPSWPVNIVSCLRYTFVAFYRFFLPGGGG
jgi:hypothetical protein